ncbi:ferric reductase-like transmembrane domain-containing protein [Parasediminibacterium paludis]|uniref:Ferric reductase-like transmembrane domain-containing protein n=1 Tax=Parasediminibacterium paludis TaxID=908966 RepID=A0ABV8Q1D9_9BACT
MESINLLDATAVIGLMAAVALTFNILFGMLLSCAYKQIPLWKQLPTWLKRLSLLDLHNWTAYIALLLVGLHPTLLLLDKASKFTWVDVLFPIHAPHQKLEVALGTIAFYALIVVMITTQNVVKKRMGFRTWKTIHLISYGTALLFIIHGIFMDPELKDKPVDFLDGEKLVAEICGLVLAMATILRYKYYVNKQKKRLG